MTMKSGRIANPAPARSAATTAPVLSTASVAVLLNAIRVPASLVKVHVLCSGNAVFPTNGRIAVAVKVGREHGHSIDEAVFALKLTNDEGLSRRTGERIRKTRARMIELSESGVPFLLTTFGKYREVLQNSDLYSGPDVVLKALESVRDRATAPN